MARKTSKTKQTKKDVVPSPYVLYEASVVEPPVDMRLMASFYKDFFGHSAKKYREDFCGTFVHSKEWIKSGRDHESWALDIADAPLRYGREVHLKELNSEQRSRLHICKRDVLKGIPNKVDLVTGVNFSYWCLKTRPLMKKYFESAFRNLSSSGVFLVDMMGGETLQSPSTDRNVVDWGKKKPRLIYYWEQKSFDPISHDADFAIHFEYGRQRKKMRNVFTYDWRIWTIPELRELLAEVGFDASYVYWEGSMRDGSGSGVFTRKEHEKGCDVWIAYLIAVKGKHRIPRTDH